jgi:hypothetical protein
MSQKPTIIDVTQAIEKGYTVKFGDDLFVGAVKDAPKLTPSKLTRPIKLWTGEPPQHDGKVQKTFQIQERCNFRETEKDKPCELKLIVTRRFNQKPQYDDSGFGAQLNYDDKDVRQYAYCAKHGGIGPSKW